MNGTEYPATARQVAATDRATPTRQTYQVPRVTALGEWMALTLANSTPPGGDAGLPGALKLFS